MARQRFRNLQLRRFSALGAPLAAIGLYGVIAFATGRTGEIGLRMALGPQRGHVLAFVTSDGLRLGAVGAAIGLIDGHRPRHFAPSRIAAQVGDGGRRHHPALASELTRSAAAPTRRAISR